jgi:hypothetical protein
MAELSNSGGADPVSSVDTVSFDENEIGEPFCFSSAPVAVPTYAFHPVPLPPLAPGEVMTRFPRDVVDDGAVAPVLVKPEVGSVHGVPIAIGDPF